MKIRYFADTDMLYTEFHDVPVHASERAGIPASSRTSAAHPNRSVPAARLG